MNSQLHIPHCSNRHSQNRNTFDSQRSPGIAATAADIGDSHLLRHKKSDNNDRMDREKDKEEKEKRSVRVLSTCQECVTRTPSSSSTNPHLASESRAMDVLVIPWEQVIVIN